MEDGNPQTANTNANTKQTSHWLGEEYSRTRIFLRLGLSFASTLLDYVYAIAASFEIESIRGILFMFLFLYPIVNVVAWTGIQGYLEMKYNNNTFTTIRELFFPKQWLANLKSALVFGLFQFFNLLPFYIYVKIYKDHHAIFTEELVILLEQDKQNKRFYQNDDDKSFVTNKTMRTIENNMPTTSGPAAITTSMRRIEKNLGTTNGAGSRNGGELTPFIPLNLPKIQQTNSSRPRNGQANRTKAATAQSNTSMFYRQANNNTSMVNTTKNNNNLNISSTTPKNNHNHQNTTMSVNHGQISLDFSQTPIAQPQLQQNSSKSNQFQQFLPHHLHHRERRSLDAHNVSLAGGGSTGGNVTPTIMITDAGAAAVTGTTQHQSHHQNRHGHSHHHSHNHRHHANHIMNQNASSISLFKRRLQGVPDLPIQSKMSLQTQIAIEANTRFSLLTIVEEQNFQMIFESGEIMEMMFKSFPIFAIQLCNNLLQDNWSLYWFTSIYFCILLIRLLVVSVLFVKFLLLNDRMVRFLESIRYFRDEIEFGKGEIPNLIQTQQPATLTIGTLGNNDDNNNNNNNNNGIIINSTNHNNLAYSTKHQYPMPHTLDVYQLKTLKRIADLSGESASQVSRLNIAIMSEPKNADAILKCLHTAVSKFQNLTKVSLNLMNNKLGSKRISELSQFLIQSLIKCTEVCLFIEAHSSINFATNSGNNLNEEDLSMVKSKFDRNSSYEKFYLQSELMVIIFDSSRNEILVQLQVFYKRMGIEIDEDGDDRCSIHNFNQSNRHHGSMLSIPGGYADPDSVINIAEHRSSLRIQTDFKVRQFYVIVPIHHMNLEEEKMLLRIISDISIQYLEIEVNFEDSQFLSKLQIQIENLKFQMGFILSKSFMFFKNVRFVKVHTSKMLSFEFLLQADSNRYDAKPLSITGAKGLGKSIRNFSRLFDFEIIIPDNLITNHGLIHIADALPNHCRTLKLDLSNNMLGDMGSIALAQKLSQMTHLHTFNISLKDNKFLTASSVDLISQSIANMTRLKELILDFSGMDLNHKSLNKFFSRMQHMKFIETLSINLRENKMDPPVQLVVDLNKSFRVSDKMNSYDKGSFNLSKALENFGKAKVLNLDISSNNIDATGASWIIKSLGVLGELVNLTINISDNYIRKNGVVMLGQNLKKISNLQTLNLVVDSVKKPSTNHRRMRKHLRGEQRLALETMIRAEQKPLKAIFKKIEKFNKSLKELKKYVYETISVQEERILHKYILLNQKDSNNTSNFTDTTVKVGKETTMKFLVEIMESHTRTYQITSRKFSSFEDLFVKINSLTTLSSLTLSMRQNGLVNLDVEKLGQTLVSLYNLESVNLNLSENVISDIGVKRLFDYIEDLKSVLDLSIDLSSNVIKYEGAEHISRSLTKLSDRVKDSIWMHSEAVQDQLDRRQAKLEQFMQRQLERSKKLREEESRGDEVHENLAETVGEMSPCSPSIPSLVAPPKIKNIHLSIRNNKIEYVGGFALIELACKLRDEFIGVSLLMGNCGIVTEVKGKNEEKGEKDNRYGFFMIMKKELGSNFEYE